MDIRRPLYQAIASALTGILFLNPIVATAAQLAVDAAAGGNTQIGVAGNGVPIVNIATPNGAGLSHNKFSDYNVGQQGLILNNATAKTQGTQLGGIIIGNPNLKGQAAQKILNEVTGGSRSQLQGYTEVAGQGAHVIVANPNGITCNGCGFINTPRATLATGKPILNGERLQGYDVEGGEITLDGAGLNASNIDRFELITRSAKLNAELYAKQLDVVAGRNQVDAETLAATPKPDNGSAKPQLAIDSAALGGMYANTIRLVGTEQGVGVRLAGNMAASAGDIRLDANGKLELAQTAASGNLALKGQDVALNGPAYAGGSANVQASGTLSNTQSLAASSTIALQANQLSNSGVIEAGVNADNSRNAQGDVTVNAQGMRNAGTVLASRTLQATVGGTLDNQGGTLKGATATLAANALDNRQGRLLAGGQLSLNAARLDNRNGKAVATVLQVTGGALDNRLGLFSANQALSLDLASLDNSGQGTLISNGALQAKVSQQLDNHADGLLSAKGALGVQAGTLDNRGGALVGDAGLTLSGGSLNNSAQGVVSGKGAVQVDLDQLDNSQGGTLNSDAGLQLRANQVNNAGQGLIAAKGDLRANLGSLAQQGGQLLAQGALDLTVGQLDNGNGGLLAANQGVTLRGGDLLNQGGEISSRAKVAISANSLDNGAGKVVGDAGLTLDIQRLANRQGTLAGRDGLSLRGQSLDNSQGGLLSSQTGIQLQLTGALDNHAQGTLLSQGGLSISAGSLDNSAGGTLSGAGTLFARLAGALNNQGGKLLSDAGIDLAGGDLDNSHGGILSAAGDIDLQTAKLDNSQAGRIVTDAGIHLASAQLDNSQGGSLSARGAIAGSVTGLDQHGGGQLVSQSGIDLDLQGGALNNASTGLIATPGALLLRNAASVDNRGGEISSDTAFTLATGDLLNQGGKILSADRLNVQGAAVNNSQGGVLSGSNGLGLDAASLDNSQGGTLASRGDLRASVQGALDNHGDGALVASGALNVTSASLDNQGGLLSSNGNLTLTSGASDNRNGKVIAQGRLDATTANLDNRDGVLSGQQGLTLHAGDIRNGTNATGQPGGLITSQGALDLHAGQFEALGGGEVSAKGDLQLAVAKLIQQQAQLIGEGKVRIDLGSAGQRGDFDNRGGLLSAGGTLQINGLGNLDNRGGEISGSQGFALNASGSIDNGDQGRIISAGQLDLGTNALRNANQGLLSGWQGLAVNAASLDNSTGGTLSSRTGTLDVTLASALDNHDQGALVSQGKLTLAAASLNNANGILSTQGDLGLTLAGDLDNSNGGLLSAQGALTGNGKVLDNRGGQISAGSVGYDASRLDNGGGSLVSRDALRLGLLGALLNNGAGSTIASGGPLTLSAGSVENRGGQLASQGLLKVLAGGFDNRGGTVASQGGLGLTLTGALLNGQDGLIYSKAGTLDIGAASLDNTAGTLQGQLDGTLRIQGAAANQGGRITSQAGNLDVQAASLDNGSGGILSSATGWLKLVTGWFGNNGGVTQAQSLDVQATGGIDNRNGHLSAVSGDNQIVTTSLDNGNGGLYAGGLLSVSGNQLLNQSGKVGAGSLDFGLAGALNNQSGLIEASNTLNIGAASIDNVAGAIRALGQAPASVARMSLMRSASPSLMKLTTGGLLNNNLGRIEGATQDFSLQTGSLQNGGGSVLHVGSGLFGIDLAQAGLAGGNFTSNGSLSYQAANWTNNSVIQASDLTLVIGQLNQGSGGQLLASQTFSGSGGNWVNDGLIASDGSLNLHLSGSYSGTGRLSSLGNLSLGAGYIGLGATSSIAGGGTTTVSSSGSLDNSGRLTSAADLKLSAASLNNDGTLGSAGALRIDAANLLNHNGLIFSGGDMALRVGSFSNRYADVYSLGALDIAADDQGNWASSVLNSSGSLESVGDFSLRAATISNTREGLSVNDLGVYTARITELACDHRYVGDCEGSNRNGIFEVVQREKLTVSGGAAAQMTSGGNMRLLGGQLSNQSSAIAAGGALSISVDSLSNQGVVPGETQSTRVYVTARHTLGVHQDAANDFTRQYWFESSDYDPNNLSGLQPTLSHYLSTTESEISSLAKSETLSAGDQSYAAVIQAAGNADIRVGGNLDNTVVRPGYTYINPGKNTNTAVGASPVSTVVPINAQLPPSLAQQQVNPLSLPGFSLPTGSNGLFRLSGQSGSGGSASSVQGPNELSFAGQSIGPAQRQQALDVGNRQADGVSAPVASAAVNGPSSGALSVARVQGLPSSALPDNSHKYLIETNPALTSLKSFLSSDYLLGQLGYDPDRAQKRLGDGLYEQRLLQQAVVARTGQRFIDGLASDEALFKYLMDNAIAYKDALHLSVGVALSAEQVAALTHDIVWLEDAEVNGEKVLVPVLYLAQANNRLAPNGALIQGQDVSLISGGKLNNQGTLRASGSLSAMAANISNSGLVEASQRLQLLASDSIRNAQGGIIAGRDVSLTALTGDVINERSVTRIDSAQGPRTWTASFADSAARIEAANALSIAAGRDIGNLGGVLSAGRDLRLNAGRDVSLNAVETVNGQVNGSRSSSQTTTQLGAETSAGRDLDISAGRDLSAIASRLDAARDAALSAGRDVTLASAADESHSYSHTKKVTSKQDSVQQVGTQLTTGGDLSVSAGQDLILVGSQAKAQGSVALDAERDVSILSAQNQEAYFYKKKKKGSFGRSSTKQTESYDSENVASVVQAGKDLTINVSQDANGAISLNGGRDVSVVGSQLSAGRDLLLGGSGDISVQAGSEEHGASSKKSKSGFGGLSKSGSSELKTTTSQVGSEVTAGNDVVIAAGNDVGVRASSVRAGNDVEIRAGLVQSTGDINLEDGNDTGYQESEKYRSKVGLSGSGNFLSLASAKKAGQDGQTSQSVGSLVSAGRDVTLRAERDVSVVGSAVDAGRDLNVQAGRDVNVVAGESASSSSNWESKKRLGLGWDFSETSASVFAGAEKQKEKDRQSSTSNAPSQLSAGQDMSIRAGRDIVQQGSDIGAGRDIELNAGRDIRFDAGQDSSSAEHYEQKQRAGVSAQVSQSVTTGLQDVGKMGSGSSPISQVSSVLRGIDGATDLGVSAGVSAGVSQSTSRNDAQQDNARPSTVNAGRDLIAEAGRDITLVGTQAGAGRDIRLDAGRDLTIQSAESHSSNSSKDSSGSLSAGIGVGSYNAWSGAQGNSGPYMAGSVAKVDQKGSGTQQVNAHIQAGGDVDLSSSRDTTIAGTVVNGDRLSVDAGRNLTIASRQDSDKVQGDRYSLGGSISLGGGGGINASVGNTKGSSQWVNEQTRLEGRSQVDIHTGQHTQIDGAVVVADNGNLLLDTGTLGYSDIRDKDHYKSYDVSLGGAFAGKSADGQQLSRNDEGKAPNAVLQGEYSSRDREQINRATVGAGEIVVRDNPNQDLSGLNRDLDKAQKITQDKHSDEELYVSSNSVEKVGEAASAVSDLGPLVAEGLKRAAARKDLQSGSAQEKHDAAGRLLDSYGGGRLPTDVRQGLADQIGALAEQNPQQAAQAMDVMQRLLAQSQGGKQDFAQILEVPLVMALGAALVASTPQGQEAWQKVAPQLSASVREDVQKLAVYLLLLNPVSPFSTGSITTLPIADLGPLRPLGYPADSGADKADPGSAGYGAGGKVELPVSTGGSRIDESGGWSTTTPGDPVSGLGSVYSSANSDGGLKSTNLVIDTKIGSQLTGRGWTEQDIRAVVEAGAVGTTVDKRSASKTPDGLPRDDPASVYGSKTGYVVVNDRTGEIVQVSGKNDPGWIPDSRINWK